MLVLSEQQQLNHISLHSTVAESVHLKVGELLRKLCKLLLHPLLRLLHFDQVSEASPVDHRLQKGVPFLVVPV